MSAAPVTEAEVHAYVDGALPAARAAEVEAYLAEHPEEAARVLAYREQIQRCAAVRSNSTSRGPTWDHIRPCARWPSTPPPPHGWPWAGIGWHLHAYSTDRQIERGGHAGGDRNIV